jgi:HEAT repeat protein
VPLPPGGRPPITGGDLPSGRGKGGRGLETLDDTSWEYWWRLNRSDVLPRVARQGGAQQGGAAEGGYARAMPAELRPAIDALIDALDDATPAVRATAAGALAGFVTDYRNRDVVAALRRIAKGHDLWLRDLCHLGLGTRRDKESADGLRLVLRSRHEKPVSRAFAALALIQIGTPEGLAEVEKAAQDLDEADVAGCVLLGLGDTRDPKYLPLLMDAARRRTGSATRLRRVRADALTALGKLGHPAAIDFLGSQLTDRENAIARSAALALGGFKGWDRASDVLRDKGLTSGDAFVRGFSALSLGRLGDLSAMPALAKRAQAEEVAVKPFVLLAVGLTRDAGAALLLNDALQENPRTGNYATAALAAGLLALKDEMSARLRAALSDRRVAATPACSALALGLLSDKVSVTHLLTRLWLDSSRLRPGFAESLAMIDPAAFSERVLKEFGNAKRSGTRQGMVEALALCGGPAEGAALAKLYRDTPVGDTALRTRMVGALGLIASDRHVAGPKRLLLHTYYLQPNDVLSHLSFLP